ncbi:hypothetical protein TNCV_1898771 [Trichonephila clavipes]|nr:hypothetical protein TNCV_1898771 [Trichonephila clavipes]
MATTVAYVVSVESWIRVLVQFNPLSTCKEPLPAPGNRSNERRYRGGSGNDGGEKVYLQVDDHVHPGKCPAAVSSEKKTRPSSYGVLPSPAELGYERTDAVFFFSF